jgi:hypothetical protein
MSDPRDTLITALLEGTKGGTIKWEQANARGTAFIAKRPSGTVTIQAAQAADGSLGIGATIGSVGSFFGVSAKLVIKDRAGKAVEEIESPDPTGIGAMLAHNPAASLPSLYSLVHERVTRAEATMKDLSQEFREAD